MIVVIPFNSSDKSRAERLLDAAHWVGPRSTQKRGHCILVPAHDVHPENRRKCTIAAEIAFNTVEIFVPTQSNGDKARLINHAFESAAGHVRECFREPWLWLEADCVPLKKTWLEDLFKAYSQQPKRYLGRFMQAKAGVFMSRVGIYPPDAFTDLAPKCGGAVPFERVANITPRATNTRLISVEKWTPGNTVPADAVLLNGDRSGTLIEEIIETSPDAPNRIAKAEPAAR